MAPSTRNTSISKCTSAVPHTASRRSNVPANGKNTWLRVLCPQYFLRFWTNADYSTWSDPSNTEQAIRFAPRPDNWPTSPCGRAFTDADVDTRCTGPLCMPHPSINTEAKHVCGPCDRRNQQNVAIMRESVRLGVCAGCAALAKGAFPEGTNCGCREYSRLCDACAKFVSEQAKKKAVRGHISRRKRIVGVPLRERDARFGVEIDAKKKDYRAPKCPCGNRARHTRRRPGLEVRSCVICAVDRVGQDTIVRDRNPEPLRPFGRWGEWGT
ncbi:hypothetical protein K402DRAFT_229755 [Aulographum hederae CBS 113979]|uniref:Uncharacterized protein n=1 Tax=Aulographum hederae CBS 113979 TaxID=1176131 RepID=A0A6G1HBR3_9PEZI|nr:hypothetical protein K402DRAFT_229755 [Aulographum hederae CBS 113979]